MPKEYVKDGEVVDVSASDFEVASDGTALVFARITDVADFRVWSDDLEDWRDVEWDVSVQPARLYYVD